MEQSIRTVRTLALDTSGTNQHDDLANPLWLRDVLSTDDGDLRAVHPASVVRVSQALTQSGRGRGNVRGDPSSVGTVGDVLDEL